ncbi:unnamed protein product, partial [Penicillium salamii]
MTFAGIFRGFSSLIAFILVLICVLAGSYRHFFGYSRHRDNTPPESGRWQYAPAPFYSRHVYLQGDAVMTSETRRRPLHYQVLRSLGPASTKRLAGTSAKPRVSAGTSATKRPSSPCRHLFVVLG